MRRLIIVGAGGNGRVVADIAKKMDIYDNICFIDDNADKECLGFSIIGNTSEIKKFLIDTEFFVSIGNSKTRERFIEEIINFGAKIATLIHPDAVIGSNVQIGVGSVVMAGAVINPCTIVGKGVIVNTCCSIDHDCMIEDFSHVSVGSHLAGGVQVGKHTWIGIGATISNNIKISDNILIGAGAVVIKNIDEKGVYIGVPAKMKADNK